MQAESRQSHYRESLSVSHSRRDSTSPTVGRLHKQRESFGPTVCLISKNPEEKIQSAPVKSPSEDKMHIFMLILEIERLNKMVQGKRKYSESEESSQTQYLKRQVANLKFALETSENQKNQQNYKYQRLSSSQANMITEYQAQINIQGRRLRQQEQKNSILKNKNTVLEEEIIRVRAEASRINMDILANSQVDLQKSMARERGMEIDLWKQKLSKYEVIINEQKLYINELKYEVDRLKNNELEIRQRYDYDVSHIKTENEDLLRKAQRLQRELQNQQMNTTQSRRRQAQIRQDEIQKLKVDLQIVRKQNEERKNNQRKSEESYTKEVERLRQTIIELRQKLQIMFEQKPKDQNRAQKYRTQLAQIKLQNQNLKRQLIQTKKRLTQQIDNLNEELESKEEKIRRVTKKQKKIQNEKRMNKSYSEVNVRFGGMDQIKHSKAELNEIIADVIELQDSNSRIGRLIEKKNSFASVSTTYQTRSHSNYGL